MPWSRRIDTKRDGRAAGITFVMHEVTGDQVRAAAELGPKKATLNATASLTLALGQYKYQDELIAQVYTKGAWVTKDRPPDGYNRIQVYLGPINEDMVAALESLLADVRARLRA